MGTGLIGSSDTQNKCAARHSSPLLTQLVYTI